MTSSAVERGVCKILCTPRLEELVIYLCYGGKDYSYDHLLTRFFTYEIQVCVVPISV